MELTKFETYYSIDFRNITFIFHKLNKIDNLLFGLGWSNNHFAIILLMFEVSFHKKYDWYMKDK